MENGENLEKTDDLQPVEVQALQEFPIEISGGWECRKVLYDWFIKLRERAEDDDARYRLDLWDAVEILGEIRRAMTAVYLYDDEEKKRYGSRLWAWPTSDALRNPPKNWLHRSPIESNTLDEALSKYLKRPWLQHDIIDSSVINALLFTALAEFSEEIRLGVAIGRPNWSYILSDGNKWAELALVVTLSIVGFFSKWVLLPSVARVFDKRVLISEGASMMYSDVIFAHCCCLRFSGPM